MIGFSRYALSRQRTYHSSMFADRKELKEKCQSLSKCTTRGDSVRFWFSRNYRCSFEIKRRISFRTVHFFRNGKLSYGATCTSQQRYRHGNERFTWRWHSIVPRRFKFPLNWSFCYTVKKWADWSILRFPKRFHQPAKRLSCRDKPSNSLWYKPYMTLRIEDQWKGTVSNPEYPSFDISSTRVFHSTSDNLLFYFNVRHV
jgi:hypothetical protein